MSEPAASSSPTRRASTVQVSVDGDGLDREPGILRLFSALLKRWRILLALPFAMTLAVVIVSFVLPPTFTATTSFVPEARARYPVPGMVAGVASQLGISLGAEANQSPRFYGDVAKSRELLERTLLGRYPDPRASGIPGDSATLLQILQVRGRDEADSLAHGVKKLTRLVDVSVDYQTGIVRLSVDSRYPTIAAAVANRLVSYLNDFNAKTRQSQAHERRRFVEQRIADGEGQLRTTEEDLRRFYERNRSWQQSPQLVFEEGRLRRQVEIHQEVYLTLTKEYETARIEEVNDTPVLTVIDLAIVPQERSRPNRKLLAALTLLLSGTLSLFWALAADYLEHVRQERHPDYAEFRATVDHVTGEVRDALRRARGSKGVARQKADTGGASTGDQQP